MTEAKQYSEETPGETLPVSLSTDPVLSLADVGALAESIIEPLFVKDRQHRFVLANTAFGELLGQECASLIGRCETEFLSHLNDTDTDFPVTANSGQHRERSYITSPGRVVKRHINFTPLSNGHGAVTHTLAVISNAPSAKHGTQTKDDAVKYEHERSTYLAMQQDLLRRERYDVLRQVGAVLAHQVRNHLAAVTTAVALARKAAANAPQSLGQALNLAHDAAMDASSVIGDIVEYTKIRPPRPLVTALSEIINDALELSPPPAGVYIHRDELDADVYVDPIQVRDALRKIIRNAYEAMTSQGELHFAIRANANDPTDPVELRITDTGDGISEQHRALIFEPMVTNKPLGLGLGLATALTLISNQGGTLDAIGHNNGGACFAMRLPSATTSTTT